MYSPIQFKNSKIFRLIIFLSLSLLIQLSANAQIKKGKRLMDDGFYSQAIKPLKRDFLGNDRNLDAGVLLAKCYYQLHDYQQASDIMSQIAPSLLEAADDRRFLSDVYIVNEDYTSAYLELIRLLSDDQSDPKTYLWLDKVSDLIAWDSLPNYSTTEGMKGINSIYNDYAPYIAENDELWFVSDVAGIQTVFPAEYSNQNLHLYYKAKLKKQGLNLISRPSMLFKKRDYFYHDGPISDWKGHDKYALTLREIDAPSGNTGIYFSTLSGAREDIVPFKYNETFNTGHATFSNDGLRMVFASDRLEGYGQMDLWYCDWVNNEWTEPINMGPGINTPFNEVFPTYYASRLYFSSDRLDMGYGALDVYYSNESQSFGDIVNLRAPINSAYDDFALTFLNSTEGYYSSNRKNGFGGDDIYSFQYKPEKARETERNFEFVAGQIPAGTRVEIYNNADSLVKVVEVTTPNKLNVSNLLPGKDYVMKVIGLKMDKGARLVKTTTSGEAKDSYNQNTEQEFTFEIQEISDTESAELLASNKTFREVINGKVIADLGVNTIGIPIALKDRQGVVLARSKTDDNGKFRINDIRTGQNYTLETNGLDSYHEIDIYGKTGAITQSLIPLGVNRFAYMRATAPALWMETTSIDVKNVYAVVPTNEPVTGDNVVLYNDQDKELLRPVIDEDGFMKLETMQTGKAYRLNMPQKNLSRKDILVILDMNGDTSQTVRPFDADNYFFEYLIYKDYGKVEEYGELAKTSANGMMNTLNGNSYKARILDFDLPGETRFALRSLDGLKTDTIWSNGKGVLLMNNLDEDLKYELKLVEKQFNENKDIEIFDNFNSRVYVGRSKNGKIFNFDLFGSPNFGLDKEENVDNSILKMALSGRLEAKDASDSKIFIADSKGQSLSSGYTASGGTFTIKSLTPKQQYVIESNSKDPDAVLVVKIPDSQDSLRIKRNPDGTFQVNMIANRKEEITLLDSDNNAVQVQEGARFSLPSIYYNFNSYYLKLTSRKSLDKLVKLLTDNPQLRIEIQSHTDSRGPANYNTMLSQKRADSVADYLKTAKIDGKRLVSSGKGENELTNKCKDGVHCTEDEHAINRRTEFVVLKSNTQ